MKKLTLSLVLCLSSMLNAQPAQLKESPHPEIDRSNMFDAIYTFPEQLEWAMKMGKTIVLKHRKSPVKNIVFAGMGGSAISGDIAALLCKDDATVPMISNRNYTLPSWVDRETVVILLSYSGNTEETVSCMHDAFDRGAMVVGITSGGTIKKELAARGDDVITVPGGMMPRAALGYLVGPLLYVMDQLDQIDPIFELRLENLIKELKYYRTILAGETTQKNFAYETAEQISTAMPLIYAESGTTEAVAKRWRTQLAENGKTLSSVHTLPELNHNEIVAWQSDENKAQKYGIIWIIDSAMHERNKKRYEITRNIMADNIAYQKTIRCSGQSFLERTFFSLYIGDWVSYWTAILKKVDPTPIDNIDTLKQCMSTGK